MIFNFFFIVFSFLHCAFAFAQPVSNNAELDLRHWDFSTQGNIILKGEWEFYWHQLLHPDEFQESLSTMTGLISLPASWNNYILNNDKLPGKGFATFRLKILLPNKTPPLTFKLPTMGTAYNFYVNGVKYGSNGQVAHSIQNAVPAYQPKVTRIISLQNKTLDIVLQISNFHHRRGGIWRPIILGESSQIQTLTYNNLVFDLFLFGSIFMMGLYHLGLFSLRQKDKSPLYFALYCLFISLRTTVFGERFLTLLIPELPWHIIIHIEYLTYYLAIPIFLLYTYSLYPQNFNLLLLKISVFIALFFSSLVLILDPFLYTQTRHIYDIFSVLIRIQV